ncbi:hypothetical protein, partial [Methylomonas koyamae]|uniref:hypothetical protein n=1 Tax=Methylomonas koyamae TaxID=702114 RepID=UPI001E544399
MDSFIDLFLIKAAKFKNFWFPRAAWEYISAVRRSLFLAVAAARLPGVTTQKTRYAPRTFCSLANRSPSRYALRTLVSY